MRESVDLIMDQQIDDVQKLSRFFNETSADADIVEAQMRHLVEHFSQGRLQLLLPKHHCLFTSLLASADVHQRLYHVQTIATELVAVLFSSVLLRRRQREENDADEVDEKVVVEKLTRWVLGHTEERCRKYLRWHNAQVRSLSLVISLAPGDGDDGGALWLQVVGVWTRMTLYDPTFDRVAESLRLSAARSLQLVAKGLLVKQQRNKLVQMFNSDGGGRGSAASSSCCCSLVGFSFKLFCFWRRKF